MLIDGRKIAREIIDEVRAEVSSMKIKPRLAAILVGNDPEFKKFVELKGKAAGEAGIDYRIYNFPENITTEELKSKTREISASVDGALIELPLPKSIDQQAVLNEVPVEKDVDVLSDDAQRLFYDNGSRIDPPAVEAIKIVFDKHNINVSGKKAAVFGQGVLVGKPISHWLERNGAEVYRINSKTKDPAEISKKADIIVSGVGKPGLVTGEMVRDGVIIVDYGYGKKDGKMAGDVEADSVVPRASLITPVPGGIGPVLIAVVLRNLIKLTS